MARSARSVVRPLMTTDAPDSAKHSATAKPIPALDAVTSACCPCGSVFTTRTIRF
jgi:hypothetical protein